MNLRRVLTSSGRSIVGIYFAHYHSAVGLHPMEQYWCIRGKAVPLLYSGSVPANQYLLNRVRDGTLHTVYVMRAVNSTHTLASTIPLLRDCRS